MLCFDINQVKSFSSLFVRVFGRFDHAEGRVWERKFGTAIRTSKYGIVVKPEKQAVFLRTPACVKYLDHVKNKSFKERRVE